jgi:hypothetical protein
MTKLNQSALDVVDFMQRRIATGVQVHVFLVGKRAIGLQSVPKGRSLTPTRQNKRANQRLRNQGKVYALTQQDANASNAVITCIIQVSSAYAYVLFDPGATHSFVFVVFAKKHNLEFVPLEIELCVDTLVGGVVIASDICKSCVTKIAYRELVADITLLEMKDFDVILGMDWLAANYASVDCRSKKVKFQIPSEMEFSFVGSGGKRYFTCDFGSTSKANAKEGM